MALLAFTSFNAVTRSQMAAIVRDTNGATAVSYWTWSLFAASHLSTVVAYTARSGAGLADGDGARDQRCLLHFHHPARFHKRREHRSHRRLNGETAAYKNASFPTGAYPLEPHENWVIPAKARTRPRKLGNRPPKNG
ncbi:hypothetical protein [Mesorhizobium delmotii]|uniref:Uncharacterized protein n=1 Tax=Mesorhizobium delmotii TaxID=1631247 RepID=A0A2P9ADV3_9HYPH|nr:hypothetical protein [Mesorhizobium delmotii]SJM29317.1 hypothetical protein BQ8482_111247 [Mesorhizobium delmotii]